MDNTNQSLVETDRSFDDMMHRSGRIWSAVAVLMMLLVPVFVALYFQSGPNMQGLIAAGISILIIYLPSSIIEVATYAPMLGTGATYLAFITGNLVNLKIPCAMNAREIVGTEFGTRENEIVSTLSVAVSALVTTVVLAVGVVLLVPLAPVIQNPALAPAFNMVVPALFGALGWQYISKNPKLAIVPLVAMIALCFLNPSMAGSVGTLVPISAVLSIIAARIMFKKGWM